MKISEIFYSIQGEIDTGKPTIFIRTQGCNTQPKCSFCDSKFSWNEGKEMSSEEILNKIKVWLDKCNYVVFTGGEPMLQIQDIFKLTLLIRGYNSSVNFGIETNGLIYSDMIFPFDRISISPKKQNYDINSLTNLNTNKTRYKFVYDEDLWFESIIKELHLDKEQIWIMPEGATKEEQEKNMNEVVEYCKDKGYNFCCRLHTLIWGDKRRK